jgi:C4-dicarboxylate-specific signal transduction histidine kinase
MQLNYQKSKRAKTNHDKPDCLDDLKVHANTLLLEQAVFNLIDNAINTVKPTRLSK